MPSSSKFRDFVLDQLRGLEKIDCKPMMGEFLLYYDDILFGGIYDDRLLLKKTNSNKKYLLCEQLPYESAKPMYFVESIDDSEYLKKLVVETCIDLKKAKKNS